jgi:hypothetical protein
LLSNAGSWSTRKYEVAVVVNGGGAPSIWIELCWVDKNFRIIQDYFDTDTKIGSFGKLIIANFDIFGSVSWENIVDRSIEPRYLLDEIG